MKKQGLFALATFAGLVSSLAAPPRELLFPGSLLDQPSINSPWSSLESQDRFFFSTAFGSMRTTPEYLPAFDPSEPLTATYTGPSDNKSSVDRIVDLRAPNRIHVGGEVGFLYGKSTGRYGREDFVGYIIGTVGNEHISVTAGYYRQETTFSNPHFRR